MTIDLEPIGYVRTARTDLSDDYWGGLESRIELDEAAYGPDALAGVTDFSHVEVIFHFDQVPLDRIVAGARHPRGNTDWPKLGIFAQRGKNRPNRLGLTVCRVLGVDGAALIVEGLDAVDGTPVIDIKPVMAEFAPRGAVRQPGWVAELMADYWLEETDG